MRARWVGMLWWAVVGEGALLALGAALLESVTKSWDEEGSRYVDVAFSQAADVAKDSLGSGTCRTLRDRLPEAAVSGPPAIQISGAGGLIGAVEDRDIFAIVHKANLAYDVEWKKALRSYIRPGGDYIIWGPVCQDALSMLLAARPGMDDWGRSPVIRRLS